MSSASGDDLKARLVDACTRARRLGEENGLLSRKLKAETAERERLEMDVKLLSSQKQKAMDVARLLQDENRSVKEAAAARYKDVEAKTSSISEALASWKVESESTTASSKKLYAELDAALAANAQLQASNLDFAQRLEAAEKQREAELRAKAIELHIAELRAQEARLIAEKAEASHTQRADVVKKS